MSVAPSRNPLQPRVWRALKALLRAYGVKVADEDVVMISELGEELPAFAVLYTLDVPRPVVLNKEPLRLPGDPPRKER